MAPVAPDGAFEFSRVLPGSYIVRVTPSPLGTVPPVVTVAERDVDDVKVVVPEQVVRSADAEKQRQVDDVQGFQAQYADETSGALSRLQEVALSGGNVFEELMEAVSVASLGQISDALFEAGGRYRRNM